MAIQSPRDGKKNRAQKARQKNRGFIIQGRKDEEVEVPGLSEIELTLLKSGVPGSGITGGEKMILSLKFEKQKTLIEFWWSRLSKDERVRRKYILNAIAYKVMEIKKRSGWLRTADSNRIIIRWMKDQAWNDIFEQIDDIISLGNIMDG